MDRPIPYRRGVKGPKGWQLVEVDEKRFWVSPETIAGMHEPREPVLLSPEQLRRIGDYKRRTGDADPTPLDELVSSASRVPDVEAEIMDMEFSAEVFEAEMALRPTATADDRRALMTVISGCMMSPDPTPEALLAVRPDLKPMPDLARAVRTFLEIRDRKREGP